MFAGLAAAGLALAGCGSDGGPSQAELDAAVEAEKERTEAAEEARDELQEQIAALREALGIDGDADPEATIAELQADLKELQDEQTARMEADQERMAEEARMAAAATGKALFAAMGGPQAGGNALVNIPATTASTLTSAGLAIDAVAGAGSLPDTGDDSDPSSVTLEAGDSAGALGSWNGMHYDHMDTGTKVENAAVIYSNRSPAKTRPFSGGTNGKYTLITTDGPTKGSILVDGSTNSFMLAMATAFAHSGTQTHPKADEKHDAVYLRGTYDGAPGEFRCEGTTCSSINDGKGGPSALLGTWHFKPDAGAMVSQPDDAYLYYGWWVSKDKDGAPTAASAFAGIVGDVDGDQAAAELTSLTGSATYVGHAAGKWALDYSQRTASPGTSDGGHFTADAMLTAKFGAIAEGNGLTGVIDNFVANGESVPWSVKLNRSTAWSSAGATITGGTTVWSIDGTEADASGTWSGQMYDEMPGGPPGGDGNTIPTTVTGTFYSEFDDVGRMVGAFGADKQ